MGQGQGVALEVQPVHNQARSWAEVREASSPRSRVEVHQDMVDWGADTEKEHKTLVAHMVAEDRRKVAEAVEVGKEADHIDRKAGYEPDSEERKEELAAGNPRVLGGKNRQVGTEEAGRGSGEGNETEAVDRRDSEKGPEPRPEEDKVRPAPKHYLEVEDTGPAAAAAEAGGIWSRPRGFSISNYQTLSLRRHVQHSLPVVGETLRRRCDASQRATWTEQERRRDTGKT